MGSNPFLPEYAEHYVTEVISRETVVQKKLRAETMQLPLHMMQISPDEGAFLAMLVKITGAKQILEIGTFTGYSSLAMALAMDAGRITACDLSEEWTDIAKRYWKEAGVEGKIELKIGPALKTLEVLLKEGRAESYDMAFIDADKPNYDGYYEACLKLVKKSGIIVFDNMLWGGAVARSGKKDESTKALVELNLKLRDDKRVDMSMVTVADGVVIARKK